MRQELPGRPDGVGGQPLVHLILDAAEDVVVHVDALFPTVAHRIDRSSETAPAVGDALFVTEGESAQEKDRPSFRPDWARAAVVEAIGQRMPYPLDPAAVAVDRAAAWAAVGATDRAEHFLWSAKEWLLDEGERAVESPTAAAIVDELVLALRAAVQLLPVDDAGPFRMLLARLAGTTPTPGLRGASAALERLTGRQEVRLGDPGQPSLALLTGVVDPALVPQRIVAWRGAREPELSSLHVGDAGSASFTVELAPDVLPTDREARNLVAWSAVREDGRPWSSTVLQGTGSRSALSGALPLFDRDPRDLVFGVAGVSGLSSVRADRASLLQVQVDRLILDAWAVDRLSWSAATLATLRAQGRLRQWSGAQAVALVDEAEAVLSGQLVPTLAQAGDRSAAVAAESSLAALRTFQRRLSDPHRTIDAVHRPTLAELLLVAEGPPVPE